MKNLSCCTVNTLILAGLLYGYFLVFPGDVKAVLAPLEAVLRLSDALSPWLLALAGVGVLSWTALRIRGAKERGPALSGAIGTNAKDCQ